MFLSQLILNVRNPAVRRDLARPYDMHRTLLKCGFGQQTKEELGRVLFRIDPLRNGVPVVLVQSVIEPDWSALPIGYSLERPQVKPFTVSVSAGQRLRFRLRANPTKRVAVPAGSLQGKTDKDRPQGPRVGLVTEFDRLRWLLRKGEAGGFTIPGAWVKANDPLTGEEVELPNFRVDAIPEGRVGNDKPGADGGFVAVRFEGVLEVTDPAAFAAAVAAGVGSGKGFGFGLLSVAPA